MQKVDLRRAGDERFDDIKNIVSKSRIKFTGLRVRAGKNDNGIALLEKTRSHLQTPHDLKRRRFTAWMRSLLALAYFLFPINPEHRGL